METKNIQIHQQYMRSLHKFRRMRAWAPSQYPIRRISVRSCKVSKPRYLYLELSGRSEIWQELRQQCCRCACQISKRCDNLKYQSRGFETLRELTKGRIFGYWDGALVSRSKTWNWWTWHWRHRSISFFYFHVSAVIDTKMLICVI